MALYQGRWTVLFISVLSFALILFLQFSIKKINIYIPSEFQITSVLFIFSTLFLGEVAGYYEHFWWWDIFLHAGSAIAFGIVGFIILFVLYKKGRLKLMLFGWLFFLLALLWRLVFYGRFLSFPWIKSLDLTCKSLC